MDNQKLKHISTGVLREVPDKWVKTYLDNGWEEADKKASTKPKKGAKPETIAKPEMVSEDDVRDD